MALFSSSSSSSSLSLSLRSGVGGGATACCLLVMVLVSSFPFCCVCYRGEAEEYAPLAYGLTWRFYQRSCPKLESIIRKHLKKVFKNDIGQAAGLLRLHFHDCFVKGCDGSVLLDGSESGPSSEQTAIPNLTLRPEAFTIIDDLQQLVQAKCGQVVSCADLTALAARDSVYLSGGPDYKIPLGRKDGLNFATRNATLENLPAPFSNTSELLASFSLKKFDATDLVALSGAHTIGLSHCPALTPRLYPDQDPTLDPQLAEHLKLTCPESDLVNNNNTIDMDIRSPNLFDNKYYVGLVKRQGLFTSDQDLFLDPETRDIVVSFAEDEELFYEKFVLAMIKMGQLSVLTGRQGEIRANCSLRNSDNSDNNVNVHSTNNIYLASLIGNSHNSNSNSEL